MMWGRGGSPEPPVEPGRWHKSCAPWCLVTSDRRRQPDAIDTSARRARLLRTFCNFALDRVPLLHAQHLPVSDDDRVVKAARRHRRTIDVRNELQRSIATDR